MKQQPKKSRTSNSERKAQDEKELLKKIPDDTTAAQEWGERMATGKSIASGGKGGKRTRRS